MSFRNIPFYFIIITLIFALLAIWIKAYIVLSLIVGLTLLIAILNKRAIAIHFVKHNIWRRKRVEWVFVILVSIIITVVIRSYFFVVVALESKSMIPMADTSSVWLVDKACYGAVRKGDNPNKYMRTHGYGRFGYGDLVLFHLPQHSVLGDSIFSSYSDRISSKPMEVQRIWAMPGDAVQIKGGEIYVNDVQPVAHPNVSRLYFINSDTPADIADRIRKLTTNRKITNGEEFVTLRVVDIDADLHKWIDACVSDENYPDISVFPNDELLLWNRCYMGRMVVPAKGMNIELTPFNVIVYGKIINKHEGVNLKSVNNKVYVDDKECTSYTFKFNYYWVMGDNRPMSYDSRYFGFLPEHYVEGRAKLMFSK